MNISSSSMSIGVIILSQGTIDFSGNVYFSLMC